MRIDTVDFFYVRMPEVTLDADGSQDALLVRVTADGHIGWGECEASPLVSIAAFVTPRSHGACQSVGDSVLGEVLKAPADIDRISALVRRNSMDLLQAAHTLSGIEIALWDLLGRVREEPVWRMLGYAHSFAKTPYASALFADDAHETWRKARDLTARGYRAVKFGWGPFGTGSVAADGEQLAAAREGLGPDGVLLVDAGQIWGADVPLAAERLEALDAAEALWIEEPFSPSEYDAYSRLGALGSRVRVAGGEAAHDEAMARNLVQYGKVGYLQIDTGRIGGIAPAFRAAQFADAAGVTYVNHTFTSHLALSASLQPYAGLQRHVLCEYPVEPRQVAVDLTEHHIELDADGQVRLPDAPGLGIDVAVEALVKYEHSIEIAVDGLELFRSRSLASAGAHS